MDPKRLESTEPKYIPHDFRGGGLFYGSGTNETTYRLRLTSEDIAATGGNPTRIAELFIDCLYEAGALKPEISREDAKTMIRRDNPLLVSDDVAALAEGAELKCIKRTSVGKGLHYLL